jgi:hypothetical protein
MPTSMENKIFAALKTKLEELTFLRTVEYERIRMTLSDFQSHEVPGVQMYDLQEVYTHRASQIDTDWTIIVEYFQKANPDGSHDQAGLMDRKFEIERKIGENVKLDIVSVPEDGRIFHVKYNQSQTNLFLVNGMSIAQLQFGILFQKPYTGTC